ncbi:MAG: hypothetical protein JW843_10850 [Candidatus Aminicenantes bacterium]|nr:hypothetical protein [Candidatus Aminicenantes bacterium]
MKEMTYICPACHTKTTVNDSAPVPVCCGTEMILEPLPVCTTPVSAESSRSSEAESPCADGTTPRKS